MKKSNDKKFKITEIGIIPSDWELLSIKQFSTIGAGGTPNTLVDEYWGGNIPWMNSGEIHLKKISDVMGKITIKGLNNSSAKLLPKYCVLIALAGQGKTRGTVGINMIELCTNQSVAAVMPSNNINSMYLYYYLDSQYKNLRQLSDGDGGRGGLTKALLEKVMVPVPSKLEQEKIANALTRIDNLIEDYEKLIKKKEKIKQGLMQNLLTGKMRLKGYDDKWSKNKIKDIYTITRGQVLSTKKIAKSVSNINCYPVYSSQTANNGLLGYYDKYLFDTCITWTTDGENAGTVKFRKGKFYSTNVNGVLISKSNLCNECMAEIINMNTSGFIVRNGNPKLMNNVMAEIEIYYPKDINEQLAISKVFSNADNEINDLKIKFNKIINIKKGMLDNLLTGKIRL